MGEGGGWVLVVVVVDVVDGWVGLIVCVGRKDAVRWRWGDWWWVVHSASNSARDLSP